MTTFYYTKGGEEVFGPVPEDDLRQMREARILRATAMVCRAGERTWKPIGEAVGMGEASGRGGTPPPGPPIVKPPESLTSPPDGRSLATAEGKRSQAGIRGWDRTDRFGALLAPVLLLSMGTVCCRRWCETQMIGVNLSLFAEATGVAIGALAISIAVSYAFRRERRLLVRVFVALTLFVMQWIVIAHDADIHAR